jgi:hypothetical protein
MWLDLAALVFVLLAMLFAVLSLWPCDELPASREIHVRCVRCNALHVHTPLPDATLPVFTCGVCGKVHAA